MAVALDVFNVGATGTGNLSWTHTPTGTPRGAIVVIRQGGTTTDEVTSVTYGGETMTELHTPHTFTHASHPGEDGVLYTYFLGSSIPTGAQTVSVTVSGGTSKEANSFTLTADTDTEFVNDIFVDITIGNISDTLTLSGRTCFVAESFHSTAAGTSTISPLTGWTHRDETDYGSFISGSYSYDTIGSSDVTVGLTDATGNRNILYAFAISEVAATGHPAIARLAGIPFIGGATPRIQIGWR